jgi:hypothetical protein
MSLDINLPSVNFQIQGTEDFTKVMIIQMSFDMKKHRSNKRKYAPPHKFSGIKGELDSVDNWENLFFFCKIVRYGVGNGYMRSA